MQEWATQRKKCPLEILRFSPYSVQMQENADQNNSEYGHFWRSARFSDYAPHYS